jgi:hypothetical protein
MAETTGADATIAAPSTGPVYKPNAGPQSNRVLSAPLAIIYLDGTPIGKMRDIQLNEQYTRANVTELGNIYNVEVPIVGTNFTFTASASVIDLRRIGDVKNGLVVDINDTEEVAKALILGELGCTLEVYRLVKTDKKQLALDSKYDPAATNLAANSQPELLVKVQNCFIESRSFQLSDGQVATQQISGRYLTPWEAEGRAEVAPPTA